jgi:hypothetical protein
MSQLSTTIKQFEAKKDGLQQKRDGSWTLRLTIAGEDMYPEIMQAVMGTRYQCALIEVGEDEAPVDTKTEARGLWADLGATKQAGIRCSDPVFWAFLSEEITKFGDVNDHDQAAQIVREHCGVTSRADLDKPGMNASRLLWRQLDDAFQAWKVVERA